MEIRHVDNDWQITAVDRTDRIRQLAEHVMQKRRTVPQKELVAA